MADLKFNPLIAVNEKLQNKILELALTKKKNSIVKKYRVKIKGFQDVTQVPTKLLLFEYKKMGVIANNEFAHDVLKVWYNNEITLRDEVKKSLENNNYQTIEPNFGEEFYFKRLSSKDVLKNGTDHFYNPGGEALQNIEPDELTLMAFLLGWHPSKQNSSRKEKSPKKNIVLEKESKTEPDLITATNYPLENELNELSIVEGNYKKSLKILSQDSEEGKNPDKIELEKLIEYSKKIKENTEKIKNELAKLAAINKYPNISDIHNLNTTVELVNKSQLIYEFINKSKDTRELLVNLRKTLNKGAGISSIDNKDFVPAKNCHALCKELLDSLSKNESAHENTGLDIFVEKVKPISHFIELVEDCKIKNLDEENQNILLDSVKTKFGDVTREYFRGKLTFSEELANESEPTQPSVSTKIESSDSRTKKSHVVKMINNETLTKPSVSEKEPIIKSNVILTKATEVERVDLIKETPGKNIDLCALDYSNLKKDINEIAEKTITSIEKKSERNIECLNLLLWKLMSDQKPDLAFHLSKAIEQNSMELDGWHLPSWIIRSSILCKYVLYDEKDIAKSLKEDFERFNESEIQLSNKELSDAIKIFLVGSSLRPYLLAPSSNASRILFGIRLKEYPKINEVITVISSYTQNIPIDIDLLKQHQVGINYNEQVEKSRKEIKYWKEKALVKTFRGKNPVTLIWKSWLGDNGIIGEIIKDLISERISTSNLRLKLKEFEDKDFIEVNTQRSFRKLKGEQPKLRLERKAMEWIEERVLEFTSIINDWILLLSSNPNRKKDYYEKEIDDLFSEIISLKEDIVREVNELITQDNSLVSISAKFFLKCFIQIIEVLEGQIKIVEEPDPTTLIYGSLLKIPELKLGKNWLPTYSIEIFPPLIRSINKEKHSWQDVFNIALSRKDHITTSRIIKCLNEENEQKEASEFSTIRAEEVRKNNRELDILILKSIDAVEQGVSLGYILESERFSLYDKIEIIRKAKIVTDDIDFLDQQRKLDDIINSLDEIKKREIDKLVKKIPANASQNDKVRIWEALDAGDIFTANEFISKLESGDPLPISTEKIDYLLDFFPDKANQIIKYIDENRVGIVSNVENRLDFCGLNLSNIEENQAKQAARMLKVWYSLKIKEQTKDIIIQNLASLFNYIGFEDVKIENFLLKGDRSFCNLNSKPVIGKEKCPIPEFASKANGNYRIFTFWKKEPIENLVIDLKDENSKKPVIVLFMGRMNEIMRRELAYYCREHRVTAVTIDELLIIYLCSVRGSRLPVLFKLTLPFTYNEPYITTASNLPTEMFYGRKAERDAIKRLHDTSFIYGGRQLGKTALLRDIEKEFHNLESGEIAIMIDLKAEGIGYFKSTADFSSILFNEINKLKINIIPTGLSSNISFEKLLKYIENWLNEDRNRRILIFLDEADKFLELDAKDEFPITSRLKSAMENMNKRFKVIFAGLHNVQRTTRCPNNPIAHLGKPICIGPLLNNFESNEARALIKNPLEAMGFRFEKDYLITRILSQTNYYPSLIQVYCYNLLNYLYHQGYDIKETPPYLITEKHLTEAYKTAKDLIKQKFTLTLDLDERYALITYIIAYGILESGSNKASENFEGFAVSWIRENALTYWPEGFINSSSYDNIKVLLEEMVGLGILREVGQETDSYTLRTPNLLSLLGDSSYCEDQLLRKRERTPEYAPSIYRVEYTMGHRNLRSALTSADYNYLMGSKNEVSIIRGSKLQGIEFIKEFLSLRLKESVHYYDSDDSNFHEALQYFKDIAERRSKHENTLIVVSQKTPFSSEWILNAKKYINTLKSKTSFLHIIFEMDPNTFYRMANDDRNLFSLFHSEGIKVIDLKLWEKEVIKDWLEDIGCNTVNVDALIEVTGGYHNELYKFANEACNRPDKWELVISEMSDQKSTKKVIDEYLKNVGACSTIPHLYSVLDSFYEFRNEDISLDDILELNSDLAEKTVTIILEYFETLMIITRKGAYFRLNEFVENLLIKRHETVN